LKIKKARNEDLTKI